MQRGWARGAMAVAALLVAACSGTEPNRGAADADRPVTSATGDPGPPDAEAPRADAALVGRIVGPDGEPRAGVPVTVVESRSGIGLDGVLAFVFTAGIACVAAPDLCSGAERVVDAGTTGPDGTYELTLPDAYLRGYETDEDWVLQVGRAPGPGELTGPSSSFELEVNTARQEAPDLVVWDGTPSVADDGALLRVRIPPLHAGAALDDVAARFVDERGPVLWTVEGTTVDPRVLEDRTTRLVALGAADVTVRHEAGRTIYHQVVATATVPHAGSLVPLSRATPCAVSTGALVGCPFTDGDLSTATKLAADAVATIDLGAPAEIGIVVVRGSGSHPGVEAAVEVSADGASWAPLPHRVLDGTDGWSAGPPAGAGIPSARYVRVSGARALAEVSVWAPTDAERAAASGEGSGPGGGDGGDGVPWPLGALAGALALAVAVAATRVARAR